MSEPGLGYITETPRQHEPIDQVYPSEFHYHRLLAAPNITIWVSMRVFFPSLLFTEEMRMENKVWEVEKNPKKQQQPQTGNGDG